MRVGIFILVDPPTDEDVAAARAVLDAFEFEWEWTVRRNVRETGKSMLPVGFKDKHGSLGFYTQGLNRVDVDPVAKLGAMSFGRTLAHELGHLIDDTCLTHATRREIHELMHDGSPTALEDCPSGRYWRSSVAHANRPNEAFANLAPHIWCPLHAKPIDRYGPHTFARADDIRELVMADAQGNPPFDDIAGTEHEAAIRWAARHGIAFGQDGKFFPNRFMTRGQMARFLQRALDPDSDDDV
jgi:hypothetical protein